MAAEPLIGIKPLLSSPRHLIFLLQTSFRDLIEFRVRQQVYEKQNSEP